MGAPRALAAAIGFILVRCIDPVMTVLLQDTAVHGCST